MATNYDLCKQGFNAINQFKRHRTYKEIVNTDAERNYHELQMFKQMDRIELTMRAIQANERNSATTSRPPYRPTADTGTLSPADAEDDMDNEEEEGE